MLGQEINGRYQIVRRLGMGGMGEVYLVENLALKRQEAIKIVKHRLAGDGGYISRFRREARAINRVQHPNIVSLYDFGRMPDGRLYLTMEFANGPSIEQLLKKSGRFSLHRSLFIVRQLASAIGYAHDNGVIHRDLKPDNLITVSRKGVADFLKILDFGVAKIIAPGYEETAAISKEGELFGTPAYIAPEQIKGVRDDPRIDIYAIGCIAYELLTGATPFVGRPMEVLECVMEKVPPSLQVRCPEAKIPKDLNDLVMKCLEKDPDKRPQTCQELLGYFEAKQPRTTSHRRSKRESSFGQNGSSGHGKKTTGIFGTGDTPARGKSNNLSVITEAKTKVRSQSFDEFLDDSGTDELTFSDMDQMWLEESDTHTTGVFRARMLSDFNQVVLQLAESLCDLGFTKPRLLITLAEVNQIKQDWNAIETELQEVSQRSDRVLEVTQEREASLRFALGELTFNDPTSVSDSRAVSDAVQLLKQRLQLLSKQSESDLGSLSNREVALAAAKSKIEDELTAQERELAEIVKEASKKYMDDPVVETLAAEMENLSLELRKSF